MKALSMNDVDLAGKRVVMRLDLNVPMKNGVISSDKRIRAVLPTIRLALDRGACVIALSHLGRPVEGEFDEAFSLKPVAARLGELLGMSVRFVADPFAGLDIRPGEVALCENVRFLKGEKKNNPELAAKLARGSRDALNEKTEWVLHSISCRAAIKAGDKTSPQELMALAEKILSGEVPPFCPHGRPCVLKLTRKELEKQFGRIV